MTESAPYDIAVQIVNYHSVGLLTRCLETVVLDLESSGFTWIIKLLDNGSGDKIDHLAAQFKHGAVEAYYLPENRGFGAAHNYLFTAVPEAKYVLILNPDTRFVEPNTVQRLMLAIQAKPRAVVGPQLVKDGQVQAWDHGELKGFMATLLKVVDCSWYHERHSASQVAWVSGAALLIRSSVFKQVNGFDEQFFLYKEEEDLLRRVRHAGYEVWYIPSVLVYHQGGGSGARKDIHMAPSLRYFNQKYRRWYNPLPRLWTFLQVKLSIY